MKIYIKEEQRAGKKVTLKIYIGDMHPATGVFMLAKKGDSYFRKDGSLNLISNVDANPTDYPLPRHLLTDIFEKDEADKLVSAIKKTMYDEMEKLGLFDGAYEMTLKRTSKKEKQ